MGKLTARVTLLLCSIAFVHPQLTQAWGGKGHKIIATIAASQLTPTAQARVKALLANDRTGKSLSAVATWADAVRQTTRTGTANWHFVDIPVEDGKQNTYDAARDCKLDRRRGDCIIKAIARELAKLTDTSRTPRQRREALKFITHLVGDLHQPLHCAERNGDHGGNDVQVTFLGQPGWNLHSVWDIALIDNTGLTQAQYARKLMMQLKSENLTTMAAGTTIDWANESHTLAVKNAYTNTDGTPVVSGDKLNSAYVKANTTIVDQQLSRAGVRLAKMLNDALQ